MRGRWLALLAAVVVAPAGVVAACDPDSSARPSGDAGVEAAPSTRGVPATRSDPAPLTSVPIPGNPSKQISVGYPTAKTGPCDAGSGPSCAPGQCCPAGFTCQAITGVPICVAPCPADHPLHCDMDRLGAGGTCCLPNGCPAGDKFACSCPPDLPNRIGSTCSAPCPSGFPVACSSVCCAAGCDQGRCTCGAGTLPCGAGCCGTGQECVDGACMACAADHPVHCGATCCASDELCDNGVCTSSVVTCPPSFPVSCGSFCCGTGFACGANGECVGARFP